MEALPDLSWPTDATRDRLVGDWHIYQRRGGHRTSTDDVLTAWLATVRATEPVHRYLDLGCGIGSVLLMVAHKLRPVITVGIEAQTQSATMARRTVAELGMDAPAITIENQDFRETLFDRTAHQFDLITGSPPYFPLTDGVHPNDAQRRACRFEERGGVEAYCDAAARALRQDGRFVLVFQTTWHERVLRAAAGANLALRSQADIFMRSDRPAPFLSVYEFGWNGGPVERYTFAIRDAQGAHTAEYDAIRRALGTIPSLP